ncbi:hypothetical protein BDQ17DRAFT_1388437 [Cyathus striatus]|nr:hypothetical protein BDQ17DRAFT_1388437 [Cyathus striatus]
MSAALATHPDSSLPNDSPEISLGSLNNLNNSGFSTPGRHLRMPSISSRTTAQSSAALATPSPPTTFSRRKAGGGGGEESFSTRPGAGEDDGDEGGDLLDTPSAEKKRWVDGPDTPLTARNASLIQFHAYSPLINMEKHIDNLKKENFNIKLRVHFLEERLAQLAPDQIDAALKQNISLKIEVQQRGMEIKKLKKLVLSLEHELERQQRSGGSKSRERDLEEKLEEREMEIRELRRRRHAEDRNALLEDELEDLKAAFEENQEELQQLKETMERRADDSMYADGGESRRERMRVRMEDLQAENDELQARVEDLRALLAQREEEKEDLADALDAVQLEVEELKRREEAEAIERSESRAQFLEEREEREAVEDEMNAARDRIAAIMIEMQQKEDEVELKNREIDELVAEHDNIVKVVEEEWRGEVEEARGQIEELRDVLLERDTEVKELRMQVSGYEADVGDLQAKFEIALTNLEEDKDLELEQLRETIDKLSEQLYLQEDENDKLKEEKEEVERNREDDAVERERLEALATAYKEKYAGIKAELQEVQDKYEACIQEIHAHRDRQEELARHIEDLVEQLEHERQARERVEAELDGADKEHDEKMRREKRALEAKESALQSALNDLARTQSLLTQRESDLADVTKSLQAIETESKRLGESHTTTRFSLQLEVDRLKRDVERLEDELARTRKLLDDKESKNLDRESALDKLHAENRDLATQLSAQTQARLNISEKFDDMQKSLRNSEADAANLKSKVADLEQRLSKEQKSLLGAESTYRDQLTERNTLLLTIYQYMEKILGVDKTPKKGGQAETKPFTNFGVFHDNLITRLKALSQIQLEFDRRTKEAEGRFNEKLGEMRKQLEVRWKQIDKFEASVKTYAEMKTAWRRKYSAKEGEIDALKATNTEMAAQLAGMKRPGGGDSMEVRSLSTRAANAERRLNNAQNQLLATEEKIAQMNQKSAQADNKWEARVKEYESRLKAAEERVKRERQGGKERIAELEGAVKTLQRQLELAQKRNQQLNGVIETSKGSGTGSPTGSS